jgi:hypothetical protein
LNSRTQTCLSPLSSCHYKHVPLWLVFPFKMFVDLKVFSFSHSLGCKTWSENLLGNCMLNSSLPSSFC